MNTMSPYTVIAELNEELNYAAIEQEDERAFRKKHPIALKAGLTYSKFKKIITESFQDNYGFEEDYLVSIYPDFVTSLSEKGTTAPNPVEWFKEYCK